MPARAHQALQRVGLDSVAQRSARTLSGGQQQRLALARAWALQPDILFLDEPTASLDPSAKNEVELLIEQLAADGVTLVMSTHNLGQAKRLCTRVAYLEDGRVRGRPAGGPLFRPRAAAAGGCCIPQRRTPLALISRRLLAPAARRMPPCLPRCRHSRRTSSS